MATAAAAAGVHRSTVYRWRAADEAFAASWAAIDEARLEAGLAQVGAELARRERERAARYEELRPILGENLARARDAKVRRKWGY